MSVRHWRCLPYSHPSIGCASSLPSSVLLFTLVRNEQWKNELTRKKMVLKETICGITAASEAEGNLLQEATRLCLLSLFWFSALNQNLTIFLNFNKGFWNSNIGGCAYLTWNERKSGRYSIAAKTKQNQNNPHTNTKGHPPLVKPFPYN